ncbi:MAG: DUF1552 domain-containing protein [Myxococcales bacterium]|nr:DUF1552 domain-containing protein [Myxococcales bacterium]
MVTRRNLLKTLAGVTLLGPFMKQAWAQGVTPARVVFVVECNGIYPIAFLSQAARASLGLDAADARRGFQDVYPEEAATLRGDSLSSALCLNSLAASGADISLENRAAVLLGLSSTITGGGHSTGTAALSCAVDRSAPTIDALLAPMLKRTAPFDAIRLGTSAARTPIVYETCNFGPKKPAPILVNPALAYDTIFGSVLAGQGGAGQGAGGQERSALFDFARQDVQAALRTFRGNSNERIKLERYLTSLESLRVREGQLALMADAVRPFIPGRAGFETLLGMSLDAPDSLRWLEAQFEIATASLLGGLTNTVVLASGTSGFNVHYDSIIPSLSRHDLQHGIGTPANWNAIAAVTRRHVELVAKLARTLAATPEMGANGSMLDHTAIVFMSDNGEQHHSTAKDWPILVVGGDRLGLLTDGRTVLFPGEGAANNRQVSNLFNSLGHAMGDSTFDSFGNEGDLRIARGPLDELFAAPG